MPTAHRPPWQLRGGAGGNEHGSLSLRPAGHWRRCPRESCARTSPPHTAPELDELDTIEEILAPLACDGMKLAVEMIVISGIGDVTRATDIEARMAKSRQRPPEIEALAKRKTELLTGKQFPAPGSDAYLAYSERRARREAYCPWRKLEIPYDLPPAQNAAQARDYALGLVPNFLVGWRLCEIFFPERRGQLEAAWVASPLAKVGLPEFRKVTGEVLSWLTFGLAPPVPGSQVDRQLKDPMQRNAQLQLCDDMPATFKRIEKALPLNWLVMPDNR